MAAEGEPMAAGAHRGGRVLAQGLLEPVVGVGLVVERAHLAVAGRPVQADRLGQGAVGFQPQHGHPVRGGAGLQFGEQPPAEAEPAHGRGDPHPLDLRGRAGVELEPAAADRLRVQGGDQEQSGGRGHLVVVGREAPGRVEAAVEPAGPLIEVGPQAGACGGVPRDHARRPRPPRRSAAARSRPWPGPAGRAAAG